MGLLGGIIKGVGGIFRNPVQALAIGASFFIPGASIGLKLFVAGIATASAAYGNYQTARMQEKAKQAYNASLQDRLTNALTAEEPFQIIYGQAKVGGSIVAVLKSGDKDQYRHIVMVHAAHEVEEIGDVYINGTNIGALDVNGNVQMGSKYFKDLLPFVLVRKHLGTASDTADSTLLADCPEFWTSAHLLRGFAYTVVKVNLNFEEFQSGLPQINVIVKGKKLYDPRTGNTAWSDNPALCIYDYLTSEYGANQPTSSLVLSTFNTAANACDQTITVGKRYTCNGSFKTDQDPKQILDTLADSMAGFISQSGGWMIHAGVYTSPVLDLTEADTVGGLQISPAPALNDVFNTVKGQFSNPAKDYIVTDYQPYQNASYLAADGKEMSIDYALLFTNSNQRCQNIVRVITERARESLTVKGKFTLKAWPVQCGDRVTLTNTAFGWDEKVFRVLEWNFSPDQPVELVLQEDSAEIYDEADAVITDNYPDTGLPDQFLINAPTSLNASTQNTINADGSLVTGLYVTWTAPTNGLANQYEIQWYASNSAPATEDLYSTGFSNVASFTITPIIAGNDYYIRVRAITSNNTKSDWATYSTTSSGDLVAPGVPTSVTATAANQSIILTWTNPTDLDFNTVEIWVNTSATLVGITKVTEVAGGRFTHDDLGSLVTRYYYLRAKDHSGNVSSWTSVVSATTEKNLADQIADEIITTAAFAQGITPVEIVDTFPSTGNFEGRTVFRTTDSKLYRYGGANSTSVVGTSKQSFGSSTSGTFTLPSGLQQGDVVIVGIGSDGSLASTPSGWTSINGTTQGTEYARTIYKVMGATPDTTVAISGISTSSAAVAVAVRGVNSTTVLDVTPTVASGATGMPDSPSITTTNSNTLGIIIGYLDDDNVSSSVTAPSGYENLTVIESTTAGQTVMLATKNLAELGTESPSAFGGTGTDDWVGVTIALRSTIGFFAGVSGTDITANSITAGKIAVGAIGADQIAAKAISADKIAANQIFSAGLSVASGGAGVTVAGNTQATAPDGTVVTNGVYVFQDSQTLYGFVAENKWNTNNGGGAAYFTSNYGFTADFVMSQNAANPNAAVKNTAIAASASGGGNVFIGVTGANGGYAGYAISGTWSPFTGSHDALLNKTVSLDIGDIVIDSEIVTVKISDSLTKVIPSNVALQKGVLGVYVNRRDLTAGAPAALVDGKVIENPALFNALAIDYDNCVINGVGEGAVNVCGENGNIEIGDLIVTSSIPGKGMKQNDDIIRGYTVAKARESVTFDSPNEVKMIACIYLCG
ncbi:fibronectin type III domain-containing protein [Flavobacterium sp.]|jgi:hypothetical protein|uniref:fibronectin type III domain-containing protein n=1 Tax=Flavobacterium sp. TaxID=239 RepID=UPI0037C0B919